MKVDLTVLAIPGFIGAMAAEYAWQRRHPAPAGTSRPGDYELADTIASLTMGVGSLIAPLVAKKVLDPLTPGVGRYGQALMGTAVAATALTSVADVVRRRYAAGGLPDARHRPDVRPLRPAAPRHGGPDAAARGERDAEARHAAYRLGAALVAAAPRTSAVTAVGATALAAATTWAAQTSGQRLFRHARRDLGTGRRRRPSASSAGTSSTTGTTGSTTRAAGCGRCTSSTTRASATTSRRRCASRSPRG